MRKIFPRYTALILTKWLGSTWGILLTGLLLGGIGALLSMFSGSKNTGFCITGFMGDLLLVILPGQVKNACFCSLQRDVGIQDINPAEYLHPEYVGLAIGALLASLLFREFRARGGGAALLRFFLGASGMFGILAFWGCPLRMFLRLAGGDLSAIIGVLGLIAGISVGIVFLRSGFSLGKVESVWKPIGLLMPIGMTVLLVWVVAYDGEVVLARPPKFLALGAGLLIGFIAQRSRFCIIGSFRNSIIMRRASPLLGIGGLILSAALVNLILGQFRLGFSGQPFAHTNILWGILGAFLGGLAFTLAGACPTRQLLLASEGDVDASAFLLGMLAATWLSQHVGYVVMPDITFLDTVLVGGPNLVGKGLVIAGLMVCALMGVYVLRRAKRDDLPG